MQMCQCVYTKVQFFEGFVVLNPITTLNRGPIFLGEMLLMLTLTVGTMGGGGGSNDLAVVGRAIAPGWCMGIATQVMWCVAFRPSVCGPALLWIPATLLAATAALRVEAGPRAAGWHRIRRFRARIEGAGALVRGAPPWNTRETGRGSPGSELDVAATPTTSSFACAAVVATSRRRRERR